MTRSTPFRRTILQFSQILFTDARTFICFFPFLSAFPPAVDAKGECPSPASPFRIPRYNASSLQVIGGHFQGDLVPRKDAREALPRLLSNVSQHRLSIFKLNSKHRVRERFPHGRFYLNRFSVIRHN